jgi:hypothetical protein
LLLEEPGDGIYLYVSAIGTKAWHFRYSWVGRRARLSLGSYPELSLRETRDLRDEARALLAKGVNSTGRIIPLAASVVGSGVALAAGGTRLRWNSESMGNPE